MRAAQSVPDVMNAGIAVFHERFGQDHARCRVARAPGRVNLIGEHTDYNDGFVLPVAIDRYVSVVFAPRVDSIFRGYSIDFEQERATSFEELSPCKGPPSWFDYATGVAWVLRAEGVPVTGIDFVVFGDVPIGAGLSSSAALEIAMARALSDVSGEPWDGKRAAIAGQRVENDYIGHKSGIMDQMASALAREGTAMLLDCRDLSVETVSIPENLSVVVMDTATRRSLAGSAYNDRRASCERAVRAVRKRNPDVSALRDVSESDLDACRSGMDPTDYRRALHVVRENQRTLDMVRALRGEDEAEIAALMDGSHESLRELYQVSIPELDEIVSIAKAHPACRGARMTGAGFGGCAVALVNAEGSAAFAADVRDAYGAGELYVCRAVSGAHLVE